MPAPRLGLIETRKICRSACKEVAAQFSLTCSESATSSFLD
jgi:hypothetical protein